MQIKTITSQHRRDFTAIMVCEYCGAERHLQHGYDDANYHQNVIPNMVCPKCIRSSGGVVSSAATVPAGVVL